MHLLNQSKWYSLWLNQFIKPYKNISLFFPLLPPLITDSLSIQLLKPLHLANIPTFLDFSTWHNYYLCPAFDHQPSLSEFGIRSEDPWPECRLLSLPLPWLSAPLPFSHWGVKSQSWELLYLQNSKPELSFSAHNLFYPVFQQLCFSSSLSWHLASLLQTQPSLLDSLASKPAGFPPCTYFSVCLLNPVKPFSSFLLDLFPEDKDNGFVYLCVALLLMGKWMLVLSINRLRFNNFWWCQKLNLPSEGKCLQHEEPNWWNCRICSFKSGLRSPESSYGKLKVWSQPSIAQWEAGGLGRWSWQSPAVYSCVLVHQGCHG